MNVDLPTGVGEFARVLVGSDQITVLAAVISIGCLALAAFGVADWATSRTLGRDRYDRLDEETDGHELIPHSFVPVLPAHDRDQCRACQVFDREIAEGLAEAERFANGGAA